MGNEPTKFVTECFEKGYLKPGIKILDVGSGFGRNANWLAAKGLSVSAVNINKSEIKEAKKSAGKLGVSVKYIKADAVKLPFPDEEYDAVLDLGCSHMLSKERQVLAEKEIARVLKPGGYLIYFGFSKKHPVYKFKPESPQFRDLSNVKTTYGNDFEIITSEEISWEPNPSEKANFSRHVGLNIVMRKIG